MQKTTTNKKRAIFLGAILAVAFFVFGTPQALSFGHPDTVAPFVEITSSASYAKEQGANFGITYTASDDYGSISSCALETSQDGGISWAQRGSCAIGSVNNMTIQSAWCPDEGTALCGVKITVTDGGGNTRQHQKFYTIDGTKPVVALSSNRSNPTEQTSVIFTFSASDEYGISGFECKLDASIWGACASPKIYNGPLPEGFRTFRVRAADVAGNVSQEKSITWEIDSKAPAKIMDFVYPAGSQTYYSADTQWSSPNEDGSSGGAPLQYDIRYSFKPIQTENDWDNKTTIIKSEISPATPGSPQSMKIGPASFVANDPNLLTSSLLHFFAIKSRDEKWNWSNFSDYSIWASPKTERDPCDYDADRIFSPKSACEASGGSSACDPDTEECDLYDNPYDWRLPEAADEPDAYDWSQSSNGWPYDKGNAFWIKAFGATTKDLDQDGADAANGRIGVDVNINSKNPVTGYPDPKGADWYDNPFTLDLYSLNTPPTLAQLKNTINDLDLDTFVAEAWQGAFGGKSKTEPNDAEIKLDSASKNIAGCAYPKATESECYECTAYNPDTATGRIPPGKTQASIVRNKAVCQIEAYYTDSSKNDPGKPYKAIPGIGEQRGTIDPDEPATSVSANCRDGIDNDLDGQMDTGSDPNTRELDCPQKFGTSQIIQPGSMQTAAIFPSSGIVPCGRNADDYTTPIDESADCGFSHIFYLFDSLIKLIIGRLMPILAGLAVVLAGFLIATSRGNVEQVLRAKKTVQWALTIYVISLLSWVILSTFFAVFGVSKWTGVIPIRGEITDLQAMSVTDAGRDWKTNEWAGYLVEIQPPKNANEEPVMVKIDSNTPDTLNLLDSQPFSGVGYKYHILGTGWWSFAYDMGASAAAVNFEASPTSGTTDKTGSFTVDFTDLSPKTVTGWLWDFGDGSPASNEKSPRHTYATNGPFTASLTTTGPAGSRTKRRTIHYAPTADFLVPDSARHGRAPWSVAFQDTSTGEIDKWLWSFGDGGISAEQNPTHTYQNPGPYVVKLKVAGPGGYDTKNEINYIFVYPAPPAPEAKFSVSTIPDTLTAITTNESLAEDGFGGTSTQDDITNWLWEFKNNETGATETTTVKEPTYFFETNKTGHTIKLTAKGPGGENTAETTVIFPPGANFTANQRSGHLDSNGNFTVNFQDTSTGTVSGWKWDFDNNGSWDDFSQNPTRIFSANASYTVKLEATNPLGETSTKIMPNYIVVAPGAYFTPSTTGGEANLNVSFTNNSRCLGSCVWLWDFGDDNTSTSKNPGANSYANETYKATLTVTDSSGRSYRSDPETITVTPKANFSVDRTDFRGESSGTVTITDNSKTPANIKFWEWSFEEWTGSFDRTDTSQPSAFTYNYSSPGVYSIILRVQGPPIRINGELSVGLETISLDFTPIVQMTRSGPADRSADNGTITFDASGSSPAPGAGGTTYSWSGCASGSGSSATCFSVCESSKSATVTVSNAGGNADITRSYSWICPTYGCKDSCADPGSQNFGADLTNNALCTYTSPAACGDPAANNPASCVPPQPRNDALCTYNGCTDSCANNYDSNATTDDGSCTYTSSCCDSSATNYNSSACGLSCDVSVCTYPVSGCMTSGDACYDSSATVHDQSACCGSGGGGGKAEIEFPPRYFINLFKSSFATISKSLINAD